MAAATAVDWELYQHHPWVVQAYTSPRYGFSIESLRCLDWLVGGFMDGLGVDVEVATEMSLTVWSYVNGVALAALPGLTLDADYDGPGGLADLIEAGSPTRRRTWPVSPAVPGPANSPIPAPASTAASPGSAPDSPPGSCGGEFSPSETVGWGVLPIACADAVSHRGDMTQNAASRMIRRSAAVAAGIVAVAAPLAVVAPTASAIPGSGRRSVPSPTR